MSKDLFHCGSSITSCGQLLRQVGFLEKELHVAEIELAALRQERVVLRSESLARLEERRLDVQLSHAQEDIEALRLESDALKRDVSRMSRENGDLRRLLNSSWQELGALRAQLDPPESQVTSTILVQQQSLATAGPTRSWLEHAQKEIPGQSMRIIFPGEAPLIDTVFQASPETGGDSVVVPE